MRRMTGAAGAGTGVELPALATVPNVDLVAAGTWSLSTGEATFTTDDLASAIEASQCPAVGDPVIKLGHVDPRFDGEPAVGHVKNMELTSQGTVITGDLADMPGWLAAVGSSAYPNRSIEGAWDLKCSIGHVHPFAITALALLGVSGPGVGVLGSLEDVAALYGLAEAAAGEPRATWQLTVSGGAMAGKTVLAAGVTTEDAVEVQVEYMDVAARAGRLAAGTVAAAWGSALASRALVTPAPEQQADAVAIVDAVLAEGKIHPDSRDRWLVAVAQGGAKGAEAVAVLSKLFPAGREVAARWAREARAAGRRTPAPQAPQVSAEELAYRELYPNAASPDHEVVHPGGEGQQEEPKEAHGASTGWHTHVHADGSGGTHEHLHEHVNDSNHQVNGGLGSHVHDGPAGPPLEAAGRGVRAGIAARLQGLPVDAGMSDDQCYAVLFGDQ